MKRIFALFAMVIVLVCVAYAESNNAKPTEQPNLRYGTLLSVTKNEFDKIVVIKAKIRPSFSNRATITQNFFNIEYIAQKGWFSDYKELQYWAVADMTDGSERKVIAFTVSQETLQLLAEGKIPANVLDSYGYITMEFLLPSLR